MGRSTTTPPTPAAGRSYACPAAAQFAHSKPERAAAPATALPDNGIAEHLHHLLRYSLPGISATDRRARPTRRGQQQAWHKQFPGGDVRPSAGWRADSVAWRAAGHTL